MKVKLAIFALLLPTTVLATSVEKNKEDSKLTDDPTKITTKLGVSYSNDYDLEDGAATFSGSLAFGPVSKLNAKVNDDASDWRVGGSWLFDAGIVNFNIGKREFETGAKQTNYSVGTFVPLSSFGFAPLGMQIFPMAGYTYNDGDAICEVASGQCGSDSVSNPIDSDFILVSSESHTGYVGAFVLKPLTEGLTLIMVAAGSAGSNNYSGYFAATGLGYSFLEQHSVSVFTVKQDNSYGEDTFFGLSYSYEI